MLSEHTYKQFDTELESVRANVLKMGGLVEEQIINAVEALMKGDLELAERVEANDHNVNALEVAVDEDCAHIVARRQPTASDLRMVMMVVKTITDLERIGDEAAKIARMAKLIHKAERISLPRFSEVKYMSELVLDMLRKALDGFARLDATKAVDIARADQLVDEEFRLNLRHLITYMMEDPRTISVFIDILFVAKAIERMGDHAKNMSEYVVYMVKGKDVRHTSLEEIEKEVL
ncbi:MAG: phosphate transport system regulatory protein PhoU [Hydrogenophilales bacterium 16-64-46]|nr:MAG: phosphate transport system regulatory protein PhoU [Hydrogenophilales bacterium 12-64-13]OYZ06926.1 MAG: phosphate transport system regulatory protein PhoU [Hydrogenophilales bacterium 16-64-46]OZA39587.1 MAG: phosphate transport system regulatory protein PhoU [Hydrogenophilales bacterium 17-64-34]HQS99820.1 phosphate signaling complex protein PhoU [Thiobacillus sp.]